jgi:hypothetical protein
MGVEVYFGLLVLVHNRIVASTIEGRLTCQPIYMQSKNLQIELQYMENTPQTVDIANCLVGGLHVVDVDDFRRYESRCSTSAIEVHILMNEGRQSEIS